MNENLIEIGFTEETINGNPHPYWVWIDTSNDSAPIAVAEGKGFGGVGCNLTPEEIMSAIWKDHFNKCNCGQIIHIVNNLNKSGQPVNSSNIKAAWLAQ